MRGEIGQHRLALGLTLLRIALAEESLRSALVQLFPEEELARDAAGEAPEVIRTFDLLGQRQYSPGSPAGWADTAASWDGSDALMHRVLWASRVAARYQGGFSPQDIAAAALGERLRPETSTAIRKASSGSQALALLLMSPEFQRR